jgi:TonB family protein
LVFALFLSLDDPHPEAPRWLVQGTMPIPVHQVAPIYPDSAWRAGLEGMVVVRCLVDTVGHVESTVLRESNPAFDRAAMEAVMQWSFKPATDGDGRTHSIWVDQPLHFQLRDQASAARAHADSLWLAWGDSASRRLTTSKTDSLVRVMRGAREVWMYRLDGSGREENLRLAFGGRWHIRTAKRLEAGPLRDSLIGLLADPRVRGRQPLYQCEYTPNLGIRFLGAEGQVDVLVALCTRQISISDGNRLWSGTAYGRHHDWSKLANRAFPEDSDLKRSLSDPEQ